jgi:hypothetical protein
MRSIRGLILLVMKAMDCRVKPANRQSGGAVQRGVALGIEKSASPAFSGREIGCHRYT